MQTLLVEPTLTADALARVKAIVRSRLGTGDLLTASLEQAERQLWRPSAEVVIVFLAADTLGRGLEVIRRLREAGTRHVLAVAPATDPKLILRVLQVGADLFLDQHDLAADLEAAFTRLRVGHEGDPPAGQLLAVLPASGGCGASTLAVNLAVLLAKAHGRCNLIDLHLRKGDLAPLLDLKPQYTLADLCRNEARLDRGMYEQLLEQHQCGISLLAAPRQFGEARAMFTQGTPQALELARRLFPYVVVDLEDCFHAEQIHVLTQATKALLVCRLDFTSVRNARRILDHLAEHDLARDRIQVVVNLFGQPGELPVDEAESALGVKLTSFVPYDPKTSGSANNAGTPAALRDPDAMMVHCIAQLIGLTLEKPAKASLVTGILPKFRALFPAT